MTGDRVVVGGDGSTQAVSIRPASGREGIRFITQTAAPAPEQSAHVYVVPEDALALIASGKVDRRLFDVTLLLELKYDDAHRDSLPLIVTYAPSGSRARATGGQLPASVRSLSGAVPGVSLPSVNGMTATVPKARAQEAWRDIASTQTSAVARQAVASQPISKVWLDGMMQPVLDYSVPQIGAPAAWALGYDGDGILIAVLDSGVDSTHPDLSECVVGSRNFTTEEDVDLFGHGTHVASIIAGSGAADGGRYRGVAPGARLLSGKVCEIYGCQESSIIAGMEWAAIEEGAQVVNLSLGGTDLPGIDPVEEAVNRLTAEYGTLFVIAAGNDGPGAQTVSSPGSAERALTVGAVDRDDEVADFSGRGMTVGSFAVKPDIAGPGVEIVAARAAGTELGAPVGESYVSLSGTSMATPHVVGAAALLLQQHPEWGPSETKAALMGSASYNQSWSALDQGAGRVDVALALDTSVISETPSVSFGVAAWPHEDDEPVARTVTYRNLGPATQLALRLDIVGPEGVRPPAGMFTVTPGVVSLPQGGTVSVEVTADTSVAVPDGVYSGLLIATDDASRTVSVPIAITREEESYNLTVRHLDRAGAPTANWFATLVGLDRQRFEWFGSTGPEAEDVVLRLPKGRYAVETVVFEEDFSLTRIVAPNQQLTADRLVVMDASAAVPMSVIPPKPGIENISIVEDWVIQTECCGIQSGFSTSVSSGVAFYQAEVPPAAPDLHSLLSADWLDATTSPAEYYAGAWEEHGRLPVGPTKKMDLRKAAVVHERYAAPVSAPGAPALSSTGLGVGAYGGPEFFSVSSSLLPIETPHERTEYYYTNSKDTLWWKNMWMEDEELINLVVFDAYVGYRANKSYTTEWSQAPFSPLSADSSSLSAGAHRYGDELLIYWPMYCDRAAHCAYLASEGSAALYANGELIAENDFGEGGFFTVPPESAQYRLELAYAQAQFELTTRQAMSWTFTSAHADDEEPALLPLLIVQFDPKLNELGQAPRGRFQLPLTVMQYGIRQPAVKDPSVEVSYDDGASWAKAKVERKGKAWNLSLDHPASAGYVSLRASVRDRSGNAVEQTLIRAYALAEGP
jgi:subtilisin family serine protease